MFRGTIMPIIRSSRLYIDGRCLWYLVLWFSCCRYGVELRFMCPVCRLQAAPDDGHNGAPETCLASNKICNKYHLLHLVGILFPHINDDARSESLQTAIYVTCTLQYCLQIVNTGLHIRSFEMRLLSKETPFNSFCIDGITAHLIHFKATPYQPSSAQSFPWSHVVRVLLSVTNRMKETSWRSASRVPIAARCCA